MPYTIEDAYHDLFNLVPDVAGKAYWQAQIDATGEVFGPGSPTYLEIAAAGANVLKELATNRRMLAPLTNVLYQGNGANRVFNVTFPYIDKSHVIVRVNNVALVPGIHYTWTTDSTIELVASPGLGVTIHIYRDTPITDRFVDFQDGSAITERDLDLSNNQLFDSVQEVWDETQRIGSLAQQVISTTQGAVDGAKRYAGLAYKYERQAFDHMENARDADDRTKVFSNLAGAYADDAKLAAEATEADRTEVATKAATVAAKADQVAFTKSQIDAQVGLVNATLASASQIANSANTAASSAQTTAAQVQTNLSALQTTAATLQAQQTAALAAKDDAIAAKNLAVTAKTDAEAAAVQVASDKVTVTDAATQVATDAAAVATAKTATESARDVTLLAKTATELARDEAVAAASTVDVSAKADITYVDAEIDAVTTAIPTNNNQLTNGANYATRTGSETLTNKTLSDSTTFIVDEVDPTKKVQFQASGITTGTTRTLSLPNKSGTLATTDDIPTSTSGLVLLATTTVSSAVAAVDLTSVFDSTYDEYVIELIDVVSSAGGQMWMRVSTNNGTSFSGTGSDYRYNFMYANANAVTAQTVDSVGYIQINAVGGTATASRGGLCGSVRLFAPSNTTGSKRVLFNTTYPLTSSTVIVAGGGEFISTSAVNAVRFLFSSGNVASGMFKVYGLRKAV